jgi:hypothetical protein
MFTQKKRQTLSLATILRTMKSTENFRMKNRKKRKIIGMGFIVGIALLFLIPVVFNQILPIIYSFNKPKYLELPIPDVRKNETMHKTKPDSVLTAYLLGKDSVVLMDDGGLNKVSIKNIDSFLNRKDFKILLIKQSPNTTYNSIVRMLDKVKKANLTFYAVVDCAKNELDSVLKLKVPK